MRVTFREFPLEFFGSDLGLTLVCYSNGMVALGPNPMFVPTYDYSKDGVTACFDREGYILMERDGPMESFNYGTAYPYKEIPALKKWLVQQNMQFY